MRENPDIGNTMHPFYELVSYVTEDLKNFFAIFE